MIGPEFCIRISGDRHMQRMTTFMVNNLQFKYISIKEPERDDLHGNDI